MNGQNRKSALGALVSKAVIPYIQQIEQQSTQAIISAIQNIRFPDNSIDPMLLQQIELAIQGIGQIDISPIVETLQNMAVQIDALAVETPTAWEFEFERDSTTDYITNVRAVAV